MDRGVAWLFPVGTHREHKETERRKREALGESGGMLPQKMFIFKASEMPFPMFFRVNFHISIHEKTLTIQQFYSCAYFMATFDTTDISYNVAWDQAPW